MRLDTQHQPIHAAWQLPPGPRDEADPRGVHHGIVDPNRDELAFAKLPIAHILRERRIPFVFTTGYGEHGVPEEFKAYPTLAKPFAFGDLRSMICLALERPLERH